MLARQIYYQLKPLFPRSMRYAVRRLLAHRKLAKCKDLWPIDPAAGKSPAGWSGWPEKKSFAFVLTHDVEGPEGVAKCRQLAELEMGMGFRSSFNFIPEGPYRVSPELRKWLIDNGFEVGIHDLHHDGKLYRSKKQFTAKAAQINNYLRDWKATGFRSGFMLRNLEWIHQLNILYDSSTFDTDPFEPQCDGAGTIFPFWIPAPDLSREHLAQKKANETNGASPGKGYFELPYTLPQDSTLFLVLKEKTPDIWLKKLDWVVEHGGMALLNVHPDYLQFDKAKPEPHTFPVQFYVDLLQHVIDRHAGSFWHATPHQIAHFLSSETQKAALNSSAPKTESA